MQCDRAATAAAPTVASQAPESMGHFRPAKASGTSAVAPDVLRDADIPERGCSSGRHRHPRPFLRAAGMLRRRPGLGLAAANAWRHGFIVLYPAGGEVVTGYDYEPWHLRWGGAEAVTGMCGQGIELLKESIR